MSLETKKPYNFFTDFLDDLAQSANEVDTHPKNIPKLELTTQLIKFLETESEKIRYNLTMQDIPITHITPEGKEHFIDLTVSLIGALSMAISVYAMGVSAPGDRMRFTHTLLDDIKRQVSKDLTGLIESYDPKTIQVEILNLLTSSVKKKDK